MDGAAVKGARARRIAAPIGLAAIAIAILIIATFLGNPKSTIALDPRAAQCGLALAGQIKSQVALDRASDFWTVFPKAGKAPELEVSSPAFVVVYDGTARFLSEAGAPPGIDEAGKPIPQPSTPGEETGVVCVVIDGQRIIYVNVDTSS